MVRSRLITGIAVVTAVAAGGVGGALIGVPGLSGAEQFPGGGAPNAATNAAATDGSGSTTRPLPGSPLLDAAAKALNLTTQQLRDKLSDGKTTIADVAKQQNVDVNAVIDAMASADKDRIKSIVENPWPQFGKGPRAGAPLAPGGPASPGPGMGRGFGRLGGVAFDSVAKALGITTDELKTDLGKGQTIADIAKSKNLDVNKVIDTLVGDATARIDQAVKDGHLQQATADKLKAALKTEITKIVNDGFPKLPKLGGFPGRRGFGGPRFGSGPYPGSGSTTTTTPPAA